MIVIDLDGAPSPQTLFSQEHLRAWAEMNGVRGLRLAAGPNIACHFSQLQTGTLAVFAETNTLYKWHLA